MNSEPTQTFFNGGKTEGYFLIPLIDSVTINPISADTSQNISSVLAIKKKSLSAIMKKEEYFLSLTTDKDGPLQATIQMEINANETYTIKIAGDNLFIKEQNDSTFKRIYEPVKILEGLVLEFSFNNWQI